MNPLISVPITLLLVYRARSRNSLTPLGIAAAVVTAIAHSVHPWSVFFALLVVFFLAGTFVTKVNHDVKLRLTHSSTGTPGGEGPRNYIQVFANSIVASILIVAHSWSLRRRNIKNACVPRTGLDAEDLLVYGIVGNYVAVAADTFSSELGILSTSLPRLITAPWRTVPRGTNGGVTLRGLLAGLLGSFIISAVATSLLPFCHEASGLAGRDTRTWDLFSKVAFMLAMTLIGLCGSLLDSILGAVCQSSVVNVRTGKIVEGDGGRKVPSQGAWHGRDEKEMSRKVVVGNDLLSNNDVNFLMALTISMLSMVSARFSL